MTAKGYDNPVLKKVLRPLFNKLASLVGIPGIQGRLNAVEHLAARRQIEPNALNILERRVVDLAMAKVSILGQEIGGLQQEIGGLKQEIGGLKHEILNTEERALHATEVLSGNIENRLISFNTNLVSYVDAKQQQNIDSISAGATHQTSLHANLRQSIDAVYRQVSARPNGDLSQTSRVPAAQIDHIIDDGLYVALENYFRGSRDIVAERQREYLDSLPDTITLETPLVDLGCGRGEWLSILRELKIPALGVDSNTVCAEECKENELAFEQNDLLQFLEARADQSVGAFTMFQVLEHLPFPILIEVLRNIRRTLVPGGLLIAEVPNAKNLRVASGTFWIDPTHQRPLFPELLLFLATEIGFTKSEGRYVNDFSPKHDLDGLPEGAQIALQSILYAIDGHGDFALLATA